jgi:hypothetical protein
MDISVTNAPRVPRMKIDAARSILEAVRIRDVHKYTTRERAANRIASTNMGEQ